MCWISYDMKSLTTRKLKKYICFDFRNYIFSDFVENITQKYVIYLICFRFYWIKIMKKYKGSGSLSKSCRKTKTINPGYIFLKKTAFFRYTQISICWRFARELRSLEIPTVKLIIWWFSQVYNMRRNTITDNVFTNIPVQRVVIHSILIVIKRLG